MSDSQNTSQSTSQSTRMTPEDIEKSNALALLLGFERTRRRIKSVTKFNVTPDFRGADGKPVFLDEIGLTDEMAVSQLRGSALVVYQNKISEARKFLKATFDLDANHLDDFIQGQLGPDVGGA